MKIPKFFIYSFLSVLFCHIFSGCEIDNYDAPDCTIQGVVFDHMNQPFQVNHGAEIIRMREISWAKDDETYIANRTLKVQQDGTYLNTKIFKGTYRLLPRNGAFFPYDDVHGDGDDAGELVEINGTATQNFTVMPYLTVEWVNQPTVDNDGHLTCTVRFIRNQKSGYAMPDLRRGRLQISRSVNAGATDDTLTAAIDIENSQEGDEIVFRTLVPLRWTGINYWIRVSVEVQSNAEANYQGLPASNYTTIVQIFVP